MAEIKKTMDTFILGDNQFFGVNHHSRKTGEEKAKRFSDVREIVSVILTAKACGAGGVMLSAHDRTPEILQAMKQEPGLLENFNIYPNIPYLMKYVQKSTQEGVTGLMKGILNQDRMSNLGSLFKGGMGALAKDFRQMIESAVSIEMSVYKGCNIPSVFLHNGIVDLIIGLGMHELLKVYADIVSDRFQCEPGYGTLNLPLLLKSLDKAGIRNPIVMAPFNKAGFHMNPDQNECESVFENYEFRLMAMNILASGATNAEQAFSYLGRFRQIRNVIIGASSETHLTENARLIRIHINTRD